MDELRSWFEVPAIAHFFHVFRESFDLIEFEIEDLEEALFLDNAENVSSFLPDLVIRLLRGLYKTKDGLQVTMENYNNYLVDILTYRYETLAGRNNPMNTTNFKDLKTRAKLDIIYDMCNWRLEMQDAMDLTKNLEAEEMRVEPVGQDAFGEIYWYFYGTRLYKESGFVINSPESYESETEEKSKKQQLKRKKKKKTLVKTSKFGRAVKKRRLDYSSQESENNKSEEELDDDDDDDDDEVEEDKEKDDQKKKDEETGGLKMKIKVKSWSLVCSTMQQWEELTQSFKSSRNKNDKLLYKGLVEFLDIIPEIFQERENALQKKLLAMAPRRASYRVQLKAQQREDEERWLERERLLKSEQKAKESEERQKEFEKEKEKEREKRYKEREKNLARRAFRAKQREELKMVADNPELAKEMQMVNKEKTYQTVSFDAESDEDDKYFAMERVLDVLKDHDDAWPFLEAVDESEAPDYYAFIEHPVDMSIVAEKIKKKEYKGKHEFKEDVLMMFDNCETYNGTYSPFTKLAFKLKKVFEKLMKREFPPEVDYTDDLYEVTKEEEKLLKPKKVKLEKTPKDKTPKGPKMNIQSLQQSYKTMITPEFAHAQILQAQAQLLQGQNLPQQILSVASKPQILPKLGIPQDVIAKMSPAQLQLFMLRYGAGAFSGFNLKNQVPNLSPYSTILPSASTSSSNIPPPLSLTATDPLHKLAGAAAAMPPMKPGTTPIRIINSKPQLGRSTIPKNVRLSQVISPMNRIANTSDKLAAKLAVSPPILQLNRNNLVISSPSTDGVPTSILPLGSNWETIKNTLKAQVKDGIHAAAATTTSFQTSVFYQHSNIVRVAASGSHAVTPPNLGWATTSLRVPFPHSGASTQMISFADLIKNKQLAPNNGGTSAVTTPAMLINKSPVDSTTAPLMPGHLVIRGNNGSVAIPPNSAVTSKDAALKKVGLPLMNSNVHFIGEPGGQIKKIVMIPSSATSTVPNKSVFSGCSSMSNLVSNVQPLTTTGNLAPRLQVNNMQSNVLLSTVPITQPVVPMYLTPQGVPLQVIRPGFSGSLAHPSVPRSSIVSSILPASTSPSIASVNPIKLAPKMLTTQLPSASNQNTMTTFQIQQLHGLKKAIQQVAAVSGINSKLQNHLDSQANLVKSSPTSITKKQHLIPKKPVSGILSLNSLGQKVLISNFGKDPSSVTRISTTPTTVATTIAPPIIQGIPGIPGIKGLVHGASGNSGISFILTSNGLISINNQQTKTNGNKNKVVLKPTPKQNIISSNVPSLITQQQGAIASSLQKISPDNQKLVIPPMSSAVTIPKNNTSIITQEKLRDAEALLGLIDPTRLYSNLSSSSSSTSNGNTTSTLPTNGNRESAVDFTIVPSLSKSTWNATTSSINVIKSSGQQSNVKTNVNSVFRSMITTPVAVNMPLKNSSLGAVVKSQVKITQPENLFNQVKSIPGKINPIGTSTFGSPVRMQVPVGSIGSLRFGNNTDPIKSYSPVNVTNTIKSPVKIQLPGSSINNPVKTLPVSVTSPLKIQGTLASSVKMQIPGIVINNPLSSIPKSPGNSANIQVGNGHSTTPNKMVVDPAQIRKLEEEGRLIVTPSGQMFLLAQPVVGGTVPKSK